VSVLGSQGKNPRANEPAGLARVRVLRRARARGVSTVKGVAVVMARSKPLRMLVGDHFVKATHPDKELFPGEGVTKAAVIEHCRAVAAVMVPHLAGRALTLRRFPEGIGAEGFFQKHAADYFPDWVQVVALPTSTGGTADYVVCDDEATLVYLASHAAIEFHIRPSTIEHPDLLVVDIDPPEGDVCLQRTRRCCGAGWRGCSAYWWAYRRLSSSISSRPPH